MAISSPPEAKIGLHSSIITVSRALSNAVMILPSTQLSIVLLQLVTMAI